MKKTIIICTITLLSFTKNTPMKLPPCLNFLQTPSNKKNISALKISPKNTELAVLVKNGSFFLFNTKNGNIKENIVITAKIKSQHMKKTEIIFSKDEKYIAISYHNIIISYDLSRKADTEEYLIRILERNSNGSFIFNNDAVEQTKPTNMKFQSNILLYNISGQSKHVHLN